MVETAIKKPKSQLLAIHPSAAFEIDFGGLLQPMSDDEFFNFCQRHRELRIEMDKYGEISIMSPTGSETGGKNFELSVDFGIWARIDGTGKGFDSSTGFILPNGAKRSPDLSWIKVDRWLAVSPEQRKKFAPICPDFVVEIRSESDTLKAVQEKMAEYIENGAKLGWLIDVIGQKAFIYQPGVPVQILDKPSEVSGEPLLKGFVLQMKPFWGF
jgi:Uma2 family endonuclease